MVTLVSGCACVKAARDQLTALQRRQDTAALIMLLIQQTAAQSVGLDAMHAPDALLRRIAAIPSMATGSRRLVMLLTQLGDFGAVG